MIHLDATTKTLEVVLAGAVTTNQLPITASYSDYNDGAGTLGLGESDAVSNNTTPVTAVAAPASSVVRNIDYLSVYNKDTVSATVTVQYNDNTTIRILFQATLASGKSLQYSRERGFFVDSDTVAVSAVSLPLPSNAAQETGGNLATIAGAVSSSLVQANIAKVSGTTLDTNSGNKSAGTVRVVLATDQPGLTNSLRVDGSGVTQPVSAASLPLPTGAATSAKQPALGTAGSASTDVVTIQGIASGTSVNVASATLALESGGNLATINSNTAALDLAQNSTTSGQTGPLMQASVLTAAPTYNTGKTSPLTLTTAGALRVDASGATVPVSGTFWQSTQPVSLASVPPHAVTNAGTFAVQEADGANATLGSKADAKNSATDTTAITVMAVLKQISASVQAPPSQAVTGTFWQATQPISGTVTANLGTTAADRSSIGNSLAVNGGAANTPSISTQGCGTVAIQVTGTWSGVLGVYYQIDGSTWYPCGEIVGINTGSVRGNIVANGIYQVPAAAGALVQVQTAGGGTGTAIVSLNASAGSAAVVLANPLPAGSNAIGSVSITGSVSLPSNAAQETGGNLATIAGAVSSSKVQDNIAQWNGVAPTAAATLADGTSNPTAPLVGACSEMWNGATWDRERGNVEGTALTSATRTATTSSASITNHNGSALMAYLNITAASGIGGLTLRVFSLDPVSGGVVQLNLPSPTAITATGIYAYELSPGGSGAGSAGGFLLNQRVAGRLPRTFQIQVVHGDASNYTYSVGYAILK